MQIALYRGTSFVSRAIRFITRSSYSHAAFLLDKRSEAVHEYASPWISSLEHQKCGSVVEAWEGGVKNSPSIDTLHSPGTRVDVFAFDPPLTGWQETKLLYLLGGDIGRPYDYLDVLRFISRRRGTPGKHVFCSELVAQRCADIGQPLFNRTESWRVPPDWIGRSVALDFICTLITQ
jgi:hypothetical protein